MSDTDSTEKIRREAWMAGYQRAEEFWSKEHPCCRSLDDAERDEEYREWRAKNTVGQEKDQVSDRR